MNWDAGTDSDLKGYNVYRSNAPGGTFTKLNATLLSKTATQYVDTTAPNNATSYYQIEALTRPTTFQVAHRPRPCAARSHYQRRPVAEPNAKPVAEPIAEPVAEPNAECESVGVSDRRPIADPHIQSPRPQATLPHKALIPMVAR